MSNLPKISVIIVNYNGEKFIRDCLASVVKTNYPKFEIVVVDNGSTDNSIAVIKKFVNLGEKLGVNLRLIKSTENLFFTGGSNLGAKHAQGEKLVFLNSDTTVDKNWLMNLISSHLDMGEKSLVQPKILHYNDKNIIDNVGGKYVFPGFGIGMGRGKKDSGQYDQIQEIDYANGTCFLIDKDFFFDLGGFDDWFKLHYEDVDLNLRAKKIGGKAYYCSKSIIYHKGSLTVRSQIKSSFLLYYIRKNRLETISKNFSGLSKLIRIISLLPYYVYWSITKPITLKSIWGFINHQPDYLVNLFRFRELSQTIGSKNFSLLDLGCGTGSLIKIAQQKGIETLGVDKNPPPSKSILNSKIEDIELKKKFDIVSLYHVIEHLNFPQKGLQIAKKHLKPNGIIVIETPLIGNLTEKLLKKDYFAYHDPTHQNLLSKKELLSIINQNQLKIIKSGTTWYEFPLTLITTSFKKSIIYGIAALISYLPIRLINLFRKEPDVIRIYCKLGFEPRR